MSRGRHRDDEDFEVVTDPRLAMELELGQLPKLPRQPDDDEEYGVVSGVIIVDEPTGSRVPTRPLGVNALRVLDLQLAGERRIASQDGRVPLSERYPGQGTARRL
jgi:hypothetical protein